MSRAVDRRPGDASRQASETVLSMRRIGAMVWRYLYLIRGSWPRLVELIYWPSVQVIIWGFITLFLMTKSTFFAQATGILMSAVLLWDVLFRAQLGVSLSFFEEMWSRNLGHLMVSPLRPYEFVLGLLTMSLVRTLIGFVPASLLAIAFFGISIYELGLMLVAFFVNLAIMGWAIGIAVSGIVMRFGLGAEGLAWALVFAIAPLCGIYYPLDILPNWAQAIAAWLPAAHVFEGMRAILIDHQVRLDLLARAATLNVLYMVAGGAIFLAFLRAARIRGSLLQMGE